MKKYLLFLCAMWMVLGSAALVSADSLTSAIANPSFENPILPDQSLSFIDNFIPGWGIWAPTDPATGNPLGSAGVWNPHPSEAYSGNAPDGQNVMYTNGGPNITVGQWLNSNPSNTVTINPGSIYTLSVDVGGRGPFWPSEALWWQMNLVAQKSDGSWDVIAYINGQPEVDKFNTVSLVYEAIDPLLYNCLLGIQLVGTGTQINFDNVQLDVSAVPEPATMFLLGSGLIGIGVFVRRKFKR